MGPGLLTVKFPVGLLIGDPCLAGQEIIDLFICHLEYRSRSVFFINPFKEELFLFFLQLFLLKAGAAVKYLAEIYVGRCLICGKKKAVAALFIEIILESVQVFRAHGLQIRRIFSGPAGLRGRCRLLRGSCRVFGTHRGGKCGGSGRGIFTAFFRRPDVSLIAAGRHPGGHSCPRSSPSAEKRSRFFRLAGFRSAPAQDAADRHHHGEGQAYFSFYMNHNLRENVIHSDFLRLRN